MGTRSLSLNSDSTPRRKRSSFSLSFRKATGEQQSVDTHATPTEEAARIKKAAAWQWFTRGPGEAVLPTKRPTAGGTPAPAAAEAVGAKLGSGSEASHIETKPQSRFKAEASSRGRPPAGPPPATRASLGAAPSPDLYDEVELSGLKTQMSDFVQRLQQKQSHQKATAKPARAADAAMQPPPPRPPPAAEEPTIRRPVSSSADLTVSGIRRPIAAVRRFFRKVMSGSIHKSDSATAIECEVIPPEEAVDADDEQHHYHHYIHYHHHHYHYGAPSPEEAEFTPRHRRHSESTGIRPRIPALIWEENEQDEDDDEGSPIDAFLARRRRHSDSSFAQAIRNFTKKGDDNDKVERSPFEEPVKSSPKLLQLPRRYNSERFTNEREAPRKEEHGAEARNRMWPSPDVKSRRRHSTESTREGERTANARWSMGVPVEGGGAAGGGVYKLSGGGVGYEERAVRGRRHSEGFDTLRRQQEEAVYEELLMYGGNGYHDDDERVGLKGGGAAGGGVYKLSGGGAGYEKKGQRHSEGFDTRRRQLEEAVYEELLTYGGNGYHDHEERGGLKGRWFRRASPASMRPGEGRRLPGQAAANARQHRSPLPPVYPTSYRL